MHPHVGDDPAKGHVTLRQLFRRFGGYDGEIEDLKALEAAAEEEREIEDEAGADWNRHQDQLDRVGKRKLRRGSTAADLLKEAQADAEDTATPWRPRRRGLQVAPIPVTRADFLSVMSGCELIRDKGDMRHFQRLFSSFDPDSRHQIDLRLFLEHAYQTQSAMKAEAARLCVSSTAGRKKREQEQEQAGKGYRSRLCCASRFCFY